MSVCRLCAEGSVWTVVALCQTRQRETRRQLPDARPTCGARPKGPTGSRSGDLGQFGHIRSAREACVLCQRSVSIAQRPECAGRREEEVTRSRSVPQAQASAPQAQPTAVLTRDSTVVRVPISITLGSVPPLSRLSSIRIAESRRDCCRVACDLCHVSTLGSHHSDSALTREKLRYTVQPLYDSTILYTGVVYTHAAVKVSGSSMSYRIPRPLVDTRYVSRASSAVCASPSRELDREPATMRARPSVESPFPRGRTSCVRRVVVPPASSLRSLNLSDPPVPPFETITW
jgi:hypothetical protein